MIETSLSNHLIHQFMDYVIDSFIYLLISSERGIWMGASPETLVEKDFELYSTMALAGTKWGDDLFSQKEFDEQMLVSRDIMDRLSDEVIEVGDVPLAQLGATN